MHKPAYSPEIDPASSTLFLFHRQFQAGFAVIIFVMFCGLSRIGSSAVEWSLYSVCGVTCRQAYAKIPPRTFPLCNWNCISSRSRECAPCAMRRRIKRCAPKTDGWVQSRTPGWPASSQTTCVKRDWTKLKATNKSHPIPPRPHDFSLLRMHILAFRSGTLFTPSHIPGVFSRGDMS